jgi:transcription initiation factor TFIID subunit TAF12
MVRSWRLVSEGYRTVDIVEHMRSDVEVLQLHGSRDKVVPIHLGRALHERLYAARQTQQQRQRQKQKQKQRQKQKQEQGAEVSGLQFMEIEGALHSDLHRFAEWTNSIAAFLERL